MEKKATLAAVFEGRAWLRADGNCVRKRGEGRRGIMTEMDYTISVGSAPVAMAADFEVALAIQRIIFGSIVTVTTPSGRIREIRECEPDHRFGHVCPNCGLEC